MTTQTPNASSVDAAPKVDAPKFTPGPWIVGEREGQHWNSPSSPVRPIFRDVAYVEGVTPTRYHIADVVYPTTTGATVGANERTANAHLIAAAPDLYEALEQIANIPLANVNPFAQGWVKHIQEVSRVALAKARGE